MIFIYVFYVDLFVEQNFLMNLIVLSLTHIFCNMEGTKHYVRRVVAAFAGAAASAAILVNTSYAFFVIMTAFVLVPLMLLIAFGRQSVRQMICRIGISWLSIIIVDGVVTAINQWIGTKSLTIYVGILVLMISGALVRMLLHSVRRQQQRMQVVLSHRGRSASCIGLYDSGNRLQMPDTGEAVHIISAGMLRTLGVEPLPDRMIVYRALGTEEGKIPVIRMEQMRVKSGKKSLCCRNVWMGCAGEELLKHTDYQIILNASVHLV